MQPTFLCLNENSVSKQCEKTVRENSVANSVNHVYPAHENQCEGYDMIIGNKKAPPLWVALRINSDDYLLILFHYAAYKLNGIARLNLDDIHSVGVCFQRQLSIVTTRYRG